MGAVERFRAAVREAVGKRSVASAATDAGLPRDAIRYVLDGRDPRLSRSAEIAEALDIEFRLGRDGAASPSARRRILDEIDETRKRVDSILRSDADT